ncbi:hypothetical protein KUTeg_012990 [Tegillarca granosa]|uniref:Uncharacterized protein n=1 Tax=Tegillarca granosa TaxID=220873 RepID=A0ABQ9EUT7_TEGGR|nr:hypothetical protein KUTeg_012990 [Tegillarca granosa]
MAVKTMRTWKVLISIVVLWLLIMVYLNNVVFLSSDGGVDLELRRALRELERLKAQNEEFRSLADEINYLSNPSHCHRTLKELLSLIASNCPEAVIFTILQVSNLGDIRVLGESKNRPYQVEIRTIVLHNRQLPFELADFICNY